jgi:hypothetical protein
LHVVRPARAPGDEIDPNISSLGKWQCEEHRRVFEKHDSVEFFVCSPLRLAIDTTLLAFAKPKNIRVIAHPDAREAPHVDAT